MINFTLTEKDADKYQKSHPFPHIVIDNFLKDSLLNEVINEYKNYDNWGWDNSEYSENHQVKKFFAPWNKEGYKTIPKNTKQILDYFNSPEFIDILEDLTGIKGLIADPTLLGGGMHKIESGGKLSIHADSRKHTDTGHYRRLNLLLYLNDEWDDKWGGSLQLWDKNMENAVQEIQPILNRVVIFNTGVDTYHGHPHPLNTPEGVSRMSLALYYYTEENPDTEDSSVTSAVWKDIPVDDEKNKPTMCFATMCKNEELCIQDTLESVYKYIDYWIVCDTGSTDRTCEIVKTFFEEKGIPGELHIDEWVGFDVNKTLMMSRAKDKADYVLHLDADDLLVGDFKFTNEDNGYDSYFIPVKRGVSEWKALIIFDNRVTWKFCGVAHTTIKCLERPNRTVFDLSNRGFYISGEGIGSRAFDPKKFYYDAVKLEKQFWDTIVDDPDSLNLRSIFYTAQSFMDSDMYEEGLKWNSLYLKMNGGWIEEKFEAQMRISLCMMRLNYSNDRIIEEMEKAIKMFPDRAEPYYHIGTFCNRIKEYGLAYDYLMKAMSCDINKVKEKYLLFVDERAYGENIYDDLSVACFWTNRFKEGYEYLLQILNDSRFESQKERLLTNQKHFQDNLGIEHN